jgi:hypothetical protein
MLKIQNKKNKNVVLTINKNQVENHEDYIFMPYKSILREDTLNNTLIRNKKFTFVVNNP